LAFVVLGAIDQVDDITHLAMGGRAEQFRFRGISQIVGQLIEQSGGRVAQPLNVLELISTARVRLE
jgi:hypothetical protein